MVSLVEITAYIDEANPLEISLPTPRADGTTALLLVERLDDRQGDFDVDVEGIEAEEFSKYAGTSLRIWPLRTGAKRISSRIRVTSGGWFRARLLWVRGRLPAAACDLCRRTLATLVAAGFALIGVPMPDWTFGEIFHNLLEELSKAMRNPPLRDLLDRLHPRLADILADTIGGFDLVRAGLSQFYRHCCEQLGLCPPRRPA